MEIEYNPNTELEKDLEALYEKHKENLSTFLLIHNNKKEVESGKFNHYFRFFSEMPSYKEETANLAAMLMELAYKRLWDLKSFDPYFIYTLDKVRVMLDEYNVSLQLIKEDKIDRTEVNKKIDEFYQKCYEERYRKAEEKAEIDHVRSHLKILSNPDYIKAVSKLNEEIIKESEKEPFLKELEDMTDYEGGR